MKRKSVHVLLTALLIAATITGFEAIPFIFKHAGQLVDGLCWAETENQCGFINHEGKFELTGDYKTLVLDEGVECGNYPLCPTFSEGLALVMRDGQYGFIDAKGNCTLNLAKSQNN